MTIDEFQQENFLSLAANDLLAIDAFTRYFVDTMDISTLRERLHEQLVYEFRKLSLSDPQQLKEIMSREEWDAREYFQEINI